MQVNGVSFEEQLEVGLNAGVFGQSPPQQLGALAGTIDRSDPLAALDADRSSTPSTSRSHGC
ncbi:MAG: hypothetical protein JWM60_1670 [Solirubrobacterales bacterium]|nr:hypothetical protein [Solirubrobacterales bacterium]